MTKVIYPQIVEVVHCSGLNEFVVVGLIIIAGIIGLWIGSSK